MFFWGIITSIFWAIVISIVFWVLCAFTGKLIHVGYRMSAAQHLICFVIAIPTVILLIMFFMCNKANRAVQQVNTEITKVLMADAHFTGQLNRLINSTSSTADAEELTDYLAENFSQNISTEHPILQQFVDTKKLLENTGLKEKLSSISANVADTGRIQQIVQAAIGSFTAGIQSKIKSVRRKSVLAVILLQMIPFGIVFYRASNYRTPANYEYIYESNDYL